MDQETELNELPITQLNLQEIVLVIQELLTDLIESQGFDCVSIFNSQEIPAIPLENYMLRIHRYTQYSPECLVIAVIYIDRYNMAETQFSLNWHNVHRLLLACIMLAVKFHNDIYFNNRTFEKAGGVSATQLFEFEMEIFQKLQFSVFVSQEEYKTLLAKIYSVYIVGEESQDTQIE